MALPISASTASSSSSSSPVPPLLSADPLHGAALWGMFGNPPPAVFVNEPGIGVDMWRWSLGPDFFLLSIPFNLAFSLSLGAMAAASLADVSEFLLQM